MDRSNYNVDSLLVNAKAESYKSGYDDGRADGVADTKANLAVYAMCVIILLLAAWAFYCAVTQ